MFKQIITTFTTRNIWRMRRIRTLILSFKGLEKNCVFGRVALRENHCVTFPYMCTLDFVQIIHAVSMKRVLLLFLGKIRKHTDYSKFGYSLPIPRPL